MSVNRNVTVPVGRSALCPTVRHYAPQPLPAAAQEWLGRSPTGHLLVHHGSPGPRGLWGTSVENLSASCATFLLCSAQVCLDARRRLPLLATFVSVADSSASGGRNEPGSGALQLALHSANPSEGDPSRTRALSSTVADSPTGVPLELERISAGRLRRVAREAAMRQINRNGSTDGAADLPPAVTVSRSRF